MMSIGKMSNRRKDVRVEALSGQLRTREANECMGTWRREERKGKEGAPVHT